MENRLKWYLMIFVAFLTISFPSAQSNINYQTIFHMAVGEASVLANVRNARTNYNASAISLRINWRDYEPNSRGTYTWNIVNAAVRNVLNENLNLYVRIAMGSGKPNWSEPGGGTFQTSDYMADQSGSTDIGADFAITVRRTISFSNVSARNVLLTSYRAAVNRILAEAGSLGRLNNVILFVPTINGFEEMEYPWPKVDQGTDYSISAITGFRTYLSTKYGTIGNLNSRWGSGFGGFNSIQPSAYNWHLDPSNSAINNNITNYNLFVGRRDWYEYRQQALKSFIDAFAAETHGAGSRFGLQIGTIHDEFMEDRGFYDITPLVENVDWVIVAPIVEQEGTHEIQADYLRSVCNYWSFRRGRVVRFAEESNWPAYGGYTNTTLTSGWTRQIEDFRNRGSSAHFLFGWEEFISDPVTLNNYSAFRAFLGSIRNTTINQPTRSDAMHISQARMAVNLGHYFPEILGGSTRDGLGNYSIIPLSDRVQRDILPETNFSYQVYNPNTLDFVTDFMINDDANRGTYLSRYSKIYLPRGSYHINENTLEGILSLDVGPQLVNSTHFVAGWGRFLSTVGRQYFALRNAPEVARLIWRTRPDVQSVWPNGSEVGYVDWLVNNNSAFPEYPELNTSFSNWNQDVRDVYNSRPDLQSIFPDGYHGTGSYWGTRSLLNWVLSFGINEHPNLLNKYRDWPYSIR